MKGIAANLSLMFTELPLIDRIGAARDAGFAAVEIQFPYDLPAERLAGALERAALPLVLINLPFDPRAKVPGIATLPSAKHAFREGAEKARDYAGVLGVPAVNILAGPGASGDRIARDCLVENLASAANIFAGTETRLLLEPLNALDRTGFFLGTPGEAVEVIRACADCSPGLLFDLYHVAMAGLDPVREFTRYRDHVAHVQFADCPGRHEPGSGQVDFPCFWSALQAENYDGWCAAEYIPAAGTVPGLGWLENLKPGTGAC